MRDTGVDVLVWAVFVGTFLAGMVSRGLMVVFSHFGRLRDRADSGATPLGLGTPIFRKLCSAGCLRSLRFEFGGPTG